MKIIDTDGFVPDADQEDGFIPEGGKSPKPEMESVFLEDKGFNVGIPKGLDLDEINQNIFQTFYHEPKKNFFGGVNVGKYLLEAGKGAYADILSKGTAIGGLMQEESQKSKTITSEDFFNFADFGVKGIDAKARIAKYLANKVTGGAYSSNLDTISKRLINSTQDYIVKNKITPDQGFGNELAFGLGQGGMSALTSIGLAYATKNPSLVGALFGIHQKGMKYTEMTDMGKTPDEASTLSTLYAIPEGGLEYLGLDVFLNKLRGSAVIRRTLGRIVTEAFQEGSQQLAENLIDKYAAGKDLSAEQIAHQVGFAALVGALVGIPASVSTTFIEENSPLGKIRKDFNLNEEETSAVVDEINRRINGDTVPHVGKMLDREASEIELKNAEAEKKASEVVDKIQEQGRQQSLDQLEQALVENKDAFTEAEFEQYTNLIQEAKNGQVADEQYQTKSKTFSEFVDKWGSGEISAGNKFNFGPVSGALQLAGAKGSMLLIDQSVLKKASIEKHDIPIDEIKKLPENLDRPIAIFESTHGNGSIVVLTELKSKTGKSVVAAIRLNQKVGRLEFDEIASIHGKDSEGQIKNWLDKGLLRYYDKEKAQSWLVAQPALIAGSWPKLGSPKVYTNEDLSQGSFQQSEGAPSTFEAELKKAQSLLSRNGLQSIVFQLHKVIKTPSGNEAYGSYTPSLGLIKLIERPITTTGYHEAFHALVNSAGISQKMMDSVFQEIQQTEGVSAAIAEEKLADKFADAANQWDTLSGKVKAFFEKLWLYIKQLLGNLNQSDRERIFFRALYEGKTGFEGGQSIDGERFQERMTRQKARELADRYAMESEQARQAKEVLKPLVEIKRNLKGAFKPYSNNFLKEEISQVSKYYFSKEGVFLDEGIDKVNEVDPGANLTSDNDLIAYLKNLDSQIKTYSLDAKIGSKPTVEIPAEQMANLSERPTQAKMDKRINDLRSRIETMKKMSVEQRQQLREELLAKQAEMKTRLLGKIRQGEAKVRDLVDYINENLPVSRRGRLMKFVKNIKINTNMVKAFTRVNEEIDAYQHAEAMQRVKDAFSRALDSKQIAVEYTEKIADLASLFDESVPRETTIKRLKSTKDYIEAELKAGRDPEIPRYVYESLGRLKMVPLQYLSVAELQNIRDKIDTLTNQGKAKLSARQAVYESLKQRHIQELQNSKPLEYTPEQKPSIEGEKPGEVFKDNLKKAISQAQELHMRIMPMDVLFDLLDGLKNYQGANSRIFKASIDSSFSNYLELKQSIEDDVINLAKELKLTESNLNRIGVYAADQQENGRQKLLATGFTDAQIDSVKLTESEMKLYSAMREKLDLLRPKIAEVMRLVYNKNLDYVKDYFPFMTDFSAMSGFEIQDMFGDSVEQFGTKPKSKPEMGMTKSRVGGKQKIKIQAMDVFLRHVDNASYLVSMGQSLKLLNDIARSEQYGKAVGKDGQRLVIEWLDIISRKGNAKGSGEPLNRFLSVLRKHTGLAALGFRLSSTLIQPTALLDGAALIGGDYAARGAINVATSKEWRAFLKDNFTELRERGADDPAYLEFDDGKTLINKGAKAAFWGIKKLDLLTASAITSGAYELALAKKGKVLDLKNPDNAAIQEAQKLLRRTQSSGLFKDSPLALSQGILGNAQVGKLVFQFQSFMLNRWSLIEHDMVMYGIKKGSKGQMLNIASFLSLALIAEVGIRRLSKELIAALTDTDLPDMDEEDFWKQIGMNALTSVPFVGQVVSSVMYGSNPIPAISISSEAFETLSYAIKGKKQSTKNKNTIKAVILWLALIYGLPPGAGQLSDLAGKALQ